MKKVVYVVEDEKAINDLMNQYLKKEGYEVYPYYAYEEASAYVMDDDAYLWILDIMLNDKSGFDLIGETRLQGRGTPIIFASTRDKEFDHIAGLEKESDDYITEPFPPKELVLRVNNVIRRVYKDNNNRIMVDNYKLDEEQCKMFDYGVKIDLTIREFGLLMLLIKNKGMASNRDKILTSVWEENYFGSDCVVDDTLWRLRKRLPSLNTHAIYGYGYHLG